MLESAFGGVQVVQVSRWNRWCCKEEDPIGFHDFYSLIYIRYKFFSSLNLNDNYSSKYISHNMKHRHTPKFALQRKSFLVGTFSPTEKWRHNEIFNSEQLPSLNFMPLQISSILLFPFTLLPSRPSIFFLYIHSLSDTLSLFFLSIILLMQTFCFWKPTYHILTPFQYQTYLVW